MPKRKITLVYDDMDLNIPGYEEGDDITILNTAYFGRTKDDQDIWYNDYISITFRDNKTGKKHNRIIEKPLYTFYELKDKYTEDHNLFFIDKDKVHPVTTEYANILKAIAKERHIEDEFNANNEAGNRSGNVQLCQSQKEIFMSDINIEDYYRMLFARKFKNSIFKLSKAYLDIEVDGKNMVGEFPEMGECPINEVSYIDEVNNIQYQFILNDGSNPLVEPYRQYITSNIGMREMKEFLIGAVGGAKQAKRFGIDKLQHEFRFYNDERDLIRDIFKVIIGTRPDFLLIWNMAFDLNYIIHRIMNLGMDVLDIVSDPGFQKQYLKYYVDQRNLNEYAERGDFVYISEYTVWIDQMINFASIRKGRAQYSSFKLDAIGEVVAHVRKLDYSHITTDIMKLPYLDFRTFSWYNLMDTIVQKCIEDTTQDCDYIFTKALMNNTRYQKAHRQSVYLANRFAKDFWGYGYVIGNNVNKWNVKPSVKYPGAAVGDPKHNSIYAVMKVNGRPTLVACNLIDFDYKSLYPSIVLENNIAANTQIGRYSLPNKVHNKEHKDMYTSDEDDAKYSREGEFFENMMSGNIIEFCKRWFHLGGIKDVIHDFKEYYTDHAIPTKPLDYNPIHPTVFYKTKSPMKQALHFDPYGRKTINVLKFFKRLKDTNIDTDKLSDKIKENGLL